MNHLAPHAGPAQSKILKFAVVRSILYFVALHRKEEKLEISTISRNVSRCTEEGTMNDNPSLSPVRHSRRSRREQPPVIFLSPVQVLKYAMSFLA